MFTKICTVVGGISLYMFSASSFAQSSGVGAIEMDDEVISISGSGHHRSFPCNGRKLEILGSEHVISMSGECSHVDVSGAMNTVDVTIAPKGILQVMGSGHTIRWKATSEIKQDISGAGHKITRVNNRP